MIKRRFIDIALKTFMILVTILTLFPFYLMIVMSTYQSNDLFGGLKILPGNYLLENIKTVMQVDFARFFINSAMLSVVRTILIIFVCSLCGYGLAKYKFRMRNFLLGFTIVTLMIPGSLGMVAFVKIMKTLGWMDTYLPLIVPALANSFGVFWMRQYILQSVPDEIIECSRIDGCGEFKIFFRIVFPLLIPAVATLGFVFFIGSWNEYIMPRIVISNPKLYTIPLGIANLGTQYSNDFAARILGVVIGIAPVLAVFIAGANKTISGLTAGAVKG